MCVIYKARSTRLNRWVALKVMTAGEFNSPELKRRFRNEAEAAAALEHPNIVPIYEVGEVDGQPFFSRKLVEGRDGSGGVTSFGTPAPERIKAQFTHRRPNPKR